MSDEPKVNIGSIGSISNISGAVAIGGDVVGRDKIVGQVGGEERETMPSLGFATETAQQQFMSELESLRKLIVEAKSQIELNAGEQPGADALMQELSKLVKDLQAAKAQAGEFPVGQAAPPEQAKTLDDYLKTAGSLIEKTQQFGEKVAELSIKLAPVALPLLNGVWALLKL